MRKGRAKPAEEKIAGEDFFCGRWASLLSSAISPRKPTMAAIYSQEITEWLRAWNGGGAGAIDAAR
jgi:hypothetical protein